MKILVIIKRTPDTETEIKLTGDGKAIDTANHKYIINPYDEYAIEEALKIKEANSGATVTLASFDTPDAKEVVVKGLAMGADNGLIIDSTDVAGADSLVCAKVLAKMIEKEQPNIVLCGRQAIDDDNMHVGTMLAELLDWPHVNVVNKLDVSGSSATVEREIEGGQTEVYDVELPAIFGANKALNQPRYASLPGIMKAKKKPFAITPAAEFLADAGAATTEILSFQYPEEKPSGQVFKGEAVADMVDKLVDKLQKEAKVL